MNDVALIIVVVGVGVLVAFVTCVILDMIWPPEPRKLAGANVEATSARPHGFPVVVRPALPVGSGEDGPGRYRITGVMRQTGHDVQLHVRAVTLANAKVKAELKGIVVTAIEKASEAVE